MVAVPLAPETFKVGSKVGVRCLRVIEGHPEGDPFGVAFGGWLWGGSPLGSL